MLLFLGNSKLLIAKIDEINITNFFLLMAAKIEIEPALKKNKLISDVWPLRFLLTLKLIFI